MQASFIPTSVLTFVLLIPQNSCRAAQQNDSPHTPLAGWKAPEEPSSGPVSGIQVQASLVATTPGSAALGGHPGRRVVRDSNAWREVWHQVHSPRMPPPLPSIDFTKEMVIGATAGWADADSDFTIDSVVAQNAQLVAVVTRHDGCGPVSGSIRSTGPSVLMRVPAYERVKFVERRRPMKGCE